MPQQLASPITEHQTYSVVLSGQRYNIALRYNDACSTWSARVSQSGEVIAGYFPLSPNRIALSALPCLPASFGGLYLEQTDSNFTGSGGFESGSLTLWFFSSAEVYAAYGTVNP